MAKKKRNTQGLPPGPFRLSGVDDPDASRAHYRKLADKIERGETISRLDAERAAALIRGAVDDLPRWPGARRRGPPGIIGDPNLAAFELVWLMRDNDISQAQALARLDEAYGVAPGTVEKATRPYRQAMKSWIATLTDE